MDPVSAQHASTFRKCTSAANAAPETANFVQELTARRTPPLASLFAARTFLRASASSIFACTFPFLPTHVHARIPRTARRVAREPSTSVARTCVCPSPVAARLRPTWPSPPGGGTCHVTGCETSSVHNRGGIGSVRTVPGGPGRSWWNGRRRVGRRNVRLHLHVGQFRGAADDGQNGMER